MELEILHRFCYNTAVIVEAMAFMRGNTVYATQELRNKDYQFYADVLSVENIGEDCGIAPSCNELKGCIITSSPEDLFIPKVMPQSEPEEVIVGFYGALRPSIKDTLGNMRLAAQVKDNQAIVDYLEAKFKA